MNENTTKISDTFDLSCTCGIHKPNSTCEVFLRNNGRWNEILKVLCTKCGVKESIGADQPLCLSCLLDY